MERGNGIKSGILGLEGDNGNFHLDPSAFSIAFSGFPQQLEIWDVDLGMGAASLPRVVAGGEEEPSQGNSQVLRDSGRRLKNALGEAWDWWEGIFFLGLG